MEDDTFHNPLKTFFTTEISTSKTFYLSRQQINKNQLNNKDVVA